MTHGYPSYDPAAPRHAASKGVSQPRQTRIIPHEPDTTVQTIQSRKLVRQAL